MRRKLPRKTHQDLSKIVRFRVLGDNEIISAADFVRNERENYRPKMKEKDLNEVVITEKDEVKQIEPAKFRPMGQKGLEDFGKESEN